jgi:predicted phage terminase large subunit-like protein
MAAAYLPVKGTRKFLLYVSGTQDQADKHVAAIASLLERVGIDRSLNKYGHSRGWRRNQLRTANFAIEALGLDTAARGIKVDEARPDVMIFDDVDNVEDTPRTTEKKARSIKSTIIPAGSPDCAIAFIQNLVLEGGIAWQLANDTADFLLNRPPTPVEIAVEDLQVESVDRGDGRKVWRIVGGEATWRGQDLATCEAQINDWGLATFLREAQQEVQAASGFFFDQTAFGAAPLPDDLSGWRFCMAFDFAATQGGGDYTVAVLMGKDPFGRYWVIDVWRGQISSERVRRLLVQTVVYARERFGALTIRLPQDPGAAGKSDAESMRQLLLGEGFAAPSIRVVPVTGSKASRASNYAESVNLGNVILTDEGEHRPLLGILGDYENAHWHWPFKEEHRKFRADETHEFDDQIDPAADAHAELASGKRVMKGYVAVR